MAVKRAAALLLGVLVLLSAGCNAASHTKGPGYVLYFLTEDDPYSAAALGREFYSVAEGTQFTPGDLVQVLLSGPTAQGLSSPFPKGTMLLAWNWDKENPGNVQLTLSEQYSELTDIAQTLADYCIVLTLSRLEGVESVEICVRGQDSASRTNPVLKGDEAILFDEVITAALDKSTSKQYS